MSLVLTPRVYQRSVIFDIFCNFSYIFSDSTECDTLTNATLLPVLPKEDIYIFLVSFFYLYNYISPVSKDTVQYLFLRKQ